MFCHLAQNDALKRLKALRDAVQDFDAKELQLKSDLEVVESESLAAGEKLEMLQSRIADTVAELQLIEKNIADTRSGIIPKGKLPGLPNPSTGSSKPGAMQSLMQKMTGKELSLALC